MRREGTDSGRGRVGGPRPGAGRAVPAAFLFLLLTAAILSGGPARAADRIVSVEKMWALAEENHPRAVEASERLDSLRRDVAQRESAYDPTLNASLSGLSYRIDNDGNPRPSAIRPSLSGSLKLPSGGTLSGSVSTASGRNPSAGDSDRLSGSVIFSYPLFRWAELDGDALALRQAVSALALAEREFAQALDEVRADVLAALHADEVAAVRFALAEETYAEAERAWAEAQRRVRLGIASETELLSAQIEWLRAEQEWQNARRTRQSRRQQLLELLGLSEDGTTYSFESVLQWVGLPEPPDRDEAVDVALARSTTVAERREAAEIARLQLEEERRWPRFDSSLSLGYSNTSDSGSNTGWNIGVSFTYPILDGGQRQRTLHSREEAYERALAAVEAAERSVRQQVEEAYVQLEDARRDEEIARLELLRAGLELELLRRQAELPVATAGEEALRQGERALLRAEIGWREAVQRYQSRWVALQRLLGPVEWARLIGESDVRPFDLLEGGPRSGGDGEGSA